VNPKTLAPTTAIVFAGLTSTIMALLFRTTDMIKLTNAGCLLTYIIVSGSLVIMRYDPPTFLARSTFAINNGVDGYQVPGPGGYNKDTDLLWSDEVRPKRFEVYHDFIKKYPKMKFILKRMFNIS
jgi:hypothetical protein